MIEQNQNQDDQTQDTPPAPGSDEYNQMMVTKARIARGEEEPKDPNAPAQETQEAPKANETEVPKEFLNEDGSVNTEALLKAYQAKGEAPKEESSAGSDETGEQLAEKAGVSYEEMKQKVMENGTIEDADFAAFEKAGIPRAMVEDFINFRKAEADRNMAQAVEYLGGQESTNELLTWAAESLSDEEINTYNGMLNGPNWKRALDSLKTLKGATSRTNGEPKLTQTQQTASNSVTGYQSRDDMKADMANPLYRKTGAEGDQYRAQVAKKMQHAAWRVK